MVIRATEQNLPLTYDTTSTGLSHPHQEQQEVSEVSSPASTRASSNALKRKRLSSESSDRHSSPPSIKLSHKLAVSSTSLKMTQWIVGLTYLQLFYSLRAPAAARPFHQAGHTQSTASDSQGSHSTTKIPTSPSSALPLTEENLRKLHQENGTMAEFSTPKGKKQTTSSISKNVEDVRQFLKINGMPIEDMAAAAAFPHIIEDAMELVEGARQSPLSKKQLERIQMTRKKNSAQNETTFVTKFFRVFMDVSRKARPDKGSLHVPVDWEDREWEEDGLFDVCDKLMRPGSVPKIVAQDATQEAMLKAFPTISNPKPDGLFGEQYLLFIPLLALLTNWTGYDPDDFAEKENWVNQSYKPITEVSKGCAHPFFQVQNKTHGDFEEAINQACTGGAALVQAHRKLKELADPPKPKPKDATKATHIPTNDEPYADASTIAFSMALSPTNAIIYVHWAEVKSNDRVIYHMHPVGGWSIVLDINMKKCRAAVNNVLDWGLVERKKDIKRLLNKIYDDYTKVNTPTKGKKGAKDPSVVGDDTSPAQKRMRLEEE